MSLPLVGLRAKGSLVSDGRVATEPEDLERLFVERVNARDIDGLMACVRA
jgi:hypothetical protein